MLAKEQRRLLGRMRPTPEGKAVEAWLAGKKELAIEGVCSQEGNALYRSQGEVRLLDTLLREFGQFASE